ncbi:hypothetical protein [Lacticigenium naphthae]|uniref:hypothetical protein n=1 Tax=Lacticigenium naphthae TaxID=515351 RepID=UPI000423A78F|nr:hypothetical protein [Lacticigenium naphthae]
MEEAQWIQGELEKLFKESRDYKQKALILALKEHIAEQSNRIEQMQGELDGSLWSPRKWNE